MGLFSIFNRKKPIKQKESYEEKGKKQQTEEKKEWSEK